MASGTTTTQSNRTAAVLEDPAAKNVEATPLAPLDASKLVISQTKNPIPIPNTLSRAATKTHTDHLLTVNWNCDNGWGIPEIVPYAPFSIEPTASVLHYATACFEGAKLYRGYDGKLRVFRLFENCRRMADSATRISLPAPDPEQLLELIKALCRVEGPRWLPGDTSRGKHLYVRPTMIATDADLECKAPREVLLYVVITYWPAAPESVPAPGAWKRPEGLKLWVSPEKSVRAWPGGSGNRKIAANYGPTLQLHKLAQQHGFDQVLWLYGQEGWVTEAGGTNFFVIWKSKTGKIQLKTAPLDSGLILPGITRKSIISLAKTRFAKTAGWELDGQAVHAEAVEVMEEDFTIHDLIEASDEDRLLSAFAVGTAYFVKEVVEIEFRGRRVHIRADGVPHPALLRRWLSDIMYGAEKNDWAQVIEEQI
ncbi:hypothetical protein EKO04_010098 [Ascochyta lentis]|uniref:Branched-chain-amino-acid aminotransferase n=1 Tax=Ascochyta lentis TaxID=205686 RepID=A0A8H7IT97_9PLEO|nr:hypothetical protein EKO04_010098 [Ascochyta lentis]